MTESLLEYVLQYGYISLFALLMLGIVGLPVPDEVLLTFAGFLVSEQKLNLALTLCVSFLGSITGMSVSFIIGRRLGLPFLEKYGKRFYMTPKRLKKMEWWFQRFGKFTVVVGYFVPGLRHVTAYSAAISRWPFRLFAMYAALGGIIWVIVFVVLGLLLGHHWHLIVDAAIQSKWVVIGLLTITSGIVFYIQRRKKKNKLYNNDTTPQNTLYRKK